MKNKFFCMAFGFIFLSCGGDDTGGSHVTVTVNDFNPQIASVQHVNFNCASVLGMEMVGTALEQCGDSLSDEGINICDSYTFEFDHLNGCEDVEGQNYLTSPILTINDCVGIITGTLNGETGSCVLISYTSGTTCRCEVDTLNVPNSHNSAFASRISEGLEVIRQVAEEGREAIFDGLADPTSALFDDQTAGNFTIPCDVFPIE